MSSVGAGIAAHLQSLAGVATLTAGHAGDLERIAERVAAALDGGGKVMFCGNGGSAADAQHLATEYVVRFQSNRRHLPALALTTDTSLLTAAANDYGFEHVFARQIEALGLPGDLLFLHSTSGNSPNLLVAARAARRRDIVTVAMLAGDGGSLRHEVDHAFIVPTEHGAHAQELHLAIGHAICAAIERRFAEAQQRSS